MRRSGDRNRASCPAPPWRPWWGYLWALGGYRVTSPTAAPSPERRRGQRSTQKVWRFSSYSSSCRCCFGSMENLSSCVFRHSLNLKSTPFVRVCQRSARLDTKLICGGETKRDQCLAVEGRKELPFGRQIAAFLSHLFREGDVRYGRDRQSSPGRGSCRSGPHPPSLPLDGGGNCSWSSW